jgi:hypothetical protein
MRWSAQKKNKKQDDEVVSLLTGLESFIIIDHAASVAWAKYLC